MITGMPWCGMITPKAHNEPLADDRECAMGFRTGTTSALGMSKGQRRFVLGQTMDLNTMVWNVGLCLVLQWHHGDRLLFLGAKNSG